MIGKRFSPRRYSKYVFGKTASFISLTGAHIETGFIKIKTIRGDPTFFK